MNNVIVDGFGLWMEEEEEEEEEGMQHFEEEGMYIDIEYSEQYSVDLEDIQMVGNNTLHSVNKKKKEEEDIDNMESGNNIVVELHPVD